MSHFEMGTHGCGSAGNSGKEKVSACACCQALSQVRPASLDASLISKLEALADAVGKPPKAKKFTSYVAKVALGAKPIDDADKHADTDTQTKNDQKNGDEPEEARRIPWLPADHPLAKLWSGASGKAIMTFGVVLPALMSSLFIAFCAKRLTLVLLNHPLETIAEVLLALSVPYFNFQLWKAISNGPAKASLKRGLACGIALSSSMLIAFISVASLFFGSTKLASQGMDFSTGFLLITLLSIAAAIASLYIFFRFRKSLEFLQSRSSLATYVSVGAILPLVVLLASEIGPWSVRFLEQRAIAGNFTERKQSLDILRLLNPERQLRIECGDERAAGLCGMFLPIKSSGQHELYFAITGKPYSFRSYANNDLASLPDDYVSRHVVGDKIPGLSLVRSMLSGAVHANTLTSTMDWTFVLKNATASNQEMRAEIGLPAGGVVTNATYWHAGEPTDLGTASLGNYANGYNGSTGGYMVSDLGHGRVLFQCQSVPSDEELKVRLTIVAPLRSEGKEAAVTLPHLIASNFEHEGDQQLKLAANVKISSFAKNLRQVGDQLVGSLTTEQIEGADPGISVGLADEIMLPAVALDVAAVELAKEDAKAANKAQDTEDKSNNQVMVMIDGNSGVNAEQIAQLRSAMNKKPEKKQAVADVPLRYVVQSMVSSHAARPEHLVVVLDGSITMRSKLEEIKKALNPLASSPATLIMASQEQSKFKTAKPLKEALSELQESDFTGGQDNLQAVVQGAELAGESSGGAVLWIHGPQPVLNQEIYILTPFAAKPTFFELPVEIGPIDTYEFFKNHSEIGPFTQVASVYGKNEKQSLVRAMDALYKKWDPQNSEYVAQLSELTYCPAERQHIGNAEALELAVLHANQECSRLIAARRPTRASRIAVKYGLVTPVSCLTAYRSNGQSANESGDDFSADYSEESAPCLKGVNTAGTVRVNNLANLEALLNILANLFEIAVAGLGLAIAIEAVVGGKKSGNVFGLQIPFAPGLRAGLGIGLIFLGLTIPGMINWFVASARDANLFS